MSLLHLTIFLRNLEVEVFEIFKKGEKKWLQLYWSTYPSTSAMPVVLFFPRTITV